MSWMFFAVAEIHKERLFTHMDLASFFEDIDAHEGEGEKI